MPRRRRRRFSPSRLRPSSPPRTPPQAAPAPFFGDRGGATAWPRSSGSALRGTSLIRSCPPHWWSPRTESRPESGPAVRRSRNPCGRGSAACRPARPQGGSEHRSGYGSRAPGLLPYRRQGPWKGSVVSTPDVVHGVSSCLPRTVQHPLLPPRAAAGRALGVGAFLLSDLALAFLQAWKTPPWSPSSGIALAVGQERFRAFTQGAL